MPNAARTGHLGTISDTRAYRTLHVGDTVRVNETVNVRLPRTPMVESLGYYGQPVPIRPGQTGPTSWGQKAFRVEIDPGEPDDLRLWITPAEAGLIPTSTLGEWTLASPAGGLLQHRPPAR